MLARWPLTLRPPPPTPFGVRGSRCPPAQPPHCGPAPPGAPVDGGAPALTHPAALHLPPPVAAGLAPRRRAETGQREEPAPSPNLPGSHRHGTGCRVLLRPFRAPRTPLLVSPCTAPSPRPRARGNPYLSRPPPVSTDAPARFGAGGGRRRCFPPSLSPPPPRVARAPGPPLRYSREITARKIW